MATYVFSDVHGHNKTLQRLLFEVSPLDEDQVWCLGDMIDRGPDPLGVISTVRSIPNVHVLMGNHEDLMLSYLDPQLRDSMSGLNWGINGGAPTWKQLDKLTPAEYDDVFAWAKALPLSGYVTVGGRMYILVHAGLRPYGFSARKCWSEASVEALLKSQDAEDVLWMREDFWGQSTGLLDQSGDGPIVIAGHTPVPYVEPLADVIDRPARDEDGRCQMLRVGACEATGGVADRWAIDCGAAGGAGWGRVLMLRLDDGQEFYAEVKEGE
jgi:serine/threonine protein phosphatase 1